MNVDCIELYVSDLEEGIAYYRDGMGMELLWKTKDSAGMGMEGEVAEIVLQSERRKMDVDFKVDCVEEAVAKVKAAGGNVVHGPFDIPIGKCAVVRDKWENSYVLLDMSKGRYTTDADGNVTGVQQEEK